jgi:hypothetical protein
MQLVHQQMQLQMQVRLQQMKWPFWKQRLAEACCFAQACHKHTNPTQSRNMHYVVEHFTKNNTVAQWWPLPICAPFPM